MSDAAADAAYQHLQQLRERIPQLRASTTAGTVQRRRSDLTPTQLARQGEAHLDERWERAANAARGVSALGASPAPVDLTVLDTIREIARSLSQMVQTVHDRFGLGHWTPGRPEGHGDERTGGMSGEIPRLLHLLSKVASDPDLAHYVADETRRLNRLAAIALGEGEQVKRLDGRCPYCGAKSLKVFVDRELVMCVNTGCRCTRTTCRCQDEDRPRRHTWSRAEWDALADTLNATNTAA
ncbi:hypothetical protein [Allonocardiopsis opalescens]|uniref:Uncharacterized protein n=1 Tax=Allonocardiopsis opalescens TaxID=1144618 RepID=A0A2T0PSU6_9ACTN|nr:hypothetical protein [Allonocardiopsis opalescens]PRX91965.1 hypothetical protein CLV72_11238 [Allonocardiopsis opalescens]